jgi:hypothetical protein
LQGKSSPVHRMPHKHVLPVEASLGQEWLN